VPWLARAGVTHLCTLLRAAEQVEPVERIAAQLGCRWVWLPIRGGNVHDLRALDAATLVCRFADAVRTAPSPLVYVHCAAGIHRTGFFASLLLRLQLTDNEAVRGALAALRAVTASQLGEERFAAAMQQAEAILTRAETESRTRSGA
jgi:protein-tyrosine phosphatase